MKYLKLKSLIIALAVMGLIVLPGRFLMAGRSSNVGTTTASFLEVGVGSRATGMGNAFVAVADDISALYWNPAGLCQLKANEMVFEHIQWLADISFNFVGAGISLGRFGTVGMFINSMTVPQDEVRTIVYQDGSGEKFDAASLAAGISYAISLTDRFSIGFNAKYISERIWHESSKGFAIDVGTLYDTGFKGLRIGACISNFGTNLKLSGSDLIIYYDSDPLILGNNDKIMGSLTTDEWPLPLNMQFGIAYDLINRKYSRVTIAADAIHPIDDTEYVNIGSELGLFNMLFARAGYQAIGMKDAEQGLTFGFGLKYKLFGQSNIMFDYSFGDYGRLLNVNRFTLRLNF